MGSEHPYPHKSLNFQWTIYSYDQNAYANLKAASTPTPKSDLWRFGEISANLTFGGRPARSVEIRIGILIITL